MHTGVRIPRNGHGSTLLRGGLVVNEDGASDADVFIVDGRIARLDRDLLGRVESEEIIDAGGCIILPGAIDLHVHFEEPGNTQREDFGTGTAAAAAGGITFVVEHPLSEPPTTTVRRYREKRELVGRHAFVDFCLWGGAVPGNGDQLAGMATEGAPGFKAFMVGSEPEFPRLDAVELRGAMREIQRLGSTLVVHAEDEEIVAWETNRLRSQGRHDPLAWAESRPPKAEAVAVERAIGYAVETGCRLHLVHLSIPESVALAVAARNAGAVIGIETCPHYLTLDSTDLERLGPWAKGAPPLRSRMDVESLWLRVLAGDVDFIASDHAPWLPEEKSAGVGDMWLARNGFGSLQFLTAVGLEAWTSRDADLPSWVRISSGNPARWLGLWPTKGRIAPGSDADLAVYRVGEPRALSADALLNRQRWTPFAGMTSRYVVTDTMVRGEWVFRNGQIFGPPRGRFVPLGPR